MTTTTLRPDGAIGYQPAAVGAATCWQATSDNSDASYYPSSGSPVTLSMTTFTVPATAVVKQISARARWRSVAATGTGYLQLDFASGADIINTNTPITSTITNFTSPVRAGTLTQADIDGLRMISFAVNGGYHYELYADLVYVTKPTVVVTVVAPDPYTASNIVPIAWTPTYDSDGGGQEYRQLRIFTAAQYGAGGFNPVISPAYFDSGEVASRYWGIPSPVLTNGTTFRAYVRIAQLVNGVKHWSDYAYDQFAVSVTTSEVSTVAVSANSTTKAITVTVTRNAGTAAWNFVEVERSIDAGVTWTDVRYATYVDSTGNAATFVVVDYEAPNGVTAIYRARATRLAGSLTITGAWVTSSGATWTAATTWVLKSPTNSALNTNIVISDQPSLMRGRRTGINVVLGRSNPIVISDVISSVSGDVTMSTLTKIEADAMLAILSSAAVLLLQSPFDQAFGSRYVAFGDINELRMGEDTEPGRVWSMSFVEVDVPVDATAGQF